MRCKSNDSRAHALAVLLAVAVLPAAGCGSGNPFAQVQVRGRVTYEDGSLIPAEMIILKFEPQAEPKDEKTFPRNGMSYVNVEDGSFDVVTSHKYGDGVVRGRHRVLVVATEASGQTTAVVPPEYLDSAQTPLEIDTADSPFHLKVRKPGP